MGARSSHVPYFLHNLNFTPSRRDIWSGLIRGDTTCYSCHKSSGTANRTKDWYLVCTERGVTTYYHCHNRPRTSSPATMQEQRMLIHDKKDACAFSGPLHDSRCMSDMAHGHCIDLLCNPAHTIPRSQKQSEAAHTTQMMQFCTTTSLACARPFMISDMDEPTLM